MHTATSQSRQWVSFCLGEEVFAYQISEVKEIIPYQEPVPVPGAPENVQGVLNVRGEIVPVVSTAKMVGAAQGEAERIIILESHEGPLGMSVDSVGEIISVDPDAIDYEAGKTETIKGTVLHNEHLVILMDFLDCKAPAS